MWSRGHIAERGGGAIIELGQRAGRHLGRRLARHVEPLDRLLQAIAGPQLGIALQTCRAPPTRLRIDQCALLLGVNGTAAATLVSPWCQNIASVRVAFGQFASLLYAKTPGKTGGPERIRTFDLCLRRAGTRVSNRFTAF